MVDNPIKNILSSEGGQALKDMQLTERAARTWFFNEVKKVEYMDPRDIMHPEEQAAKTAIIPGHMYLFQYDAKHKATLPYWDRFPVIFPIEMYDDGFLGINLHYLPLDLRVQLMNALYEVAFSNKYSKDVRLRISYDILKKARKFKNFKPCVKRYLYSHVRSRFFLIDWREWSIVAYLPLARFQGAPLSEVYADSRQKIGK